MIEFKPSEFQVLDRAPSVTPFDEILNNGPFSVWAKLLTGT